MSCDQKCLSEKSCCEYGTWVVCLFFVWHLNQYGGDAIFPDTQLAAFTGVCFSFVEITFVHEMIIVFVGSLFSMQGVWHY